MLGIESRSLDRAVNALNHWTPWCVRVRVCVCGVNACACSVCGTWVCLCVVCVEWCVWCSMWYMWSAVCVCVCVNVACWLCGGQSILQDEFLIWSPEMELKLSGFMTSTCPHWALSLTQDGIFFYFNGLQLFSSFFELCIYFSYIEIMLFLVYNTNIFYFPFLLIVLVFLNFFLVSQWFFFTCHICIL